LSRHSQVSLGEILTPCHDEIRVLPAESYQTAGILNRGRGMFKREAHRGSETKYRTYYRLRSGQVVYSKLFGWEGSVAVVPSDFDGLCVSSELPVFELDDRQVVPAYFSHVVRWSGLHEMMAASTSRLGQRRQRVQVEHFLSVLVPLPSVGEQRRIARWLDGMYSQRSFITSGAARVHEVAAALCHSLCGSSARPVRIGEYLALVREPVVIRPEDEYREIGLRSFGRGIFHKDPIRGSDLGNKRVFKIRPGDLLLSNVFAWEGAVAVSAERDDGLIGSHRFLTYRALDTGTVDVGYLRHFFLSDVGLAYIQSVSPGAAGRNRTLGIKAFENLQVPLPPIEEQRRVASVLDRAQEVVRRIEERERKLDGLMASALNQAFADVG
jgi:type I restriction enzyme, S subunit